MVSVIGTLYHPFHIMPHRFVTSRLIVKSHDVVCSHNALTTLLCLVTFIIAMFEKASLRHCETKAIA